MENPRFFPVQDKEVKLEVEAIPGFSPAFYRFIEDGKLNRNKLSSYLQQQGVVQRRRRTK